MRYYHVTTHDITWELIFRLIRFPQPTENTAPIPYNRYPPLNLNSIHIYTYIHTYSFWSCATSNCSGLFIITKHRANKESVQLCYNPICCETVNLCFTESSI